MIYIDYDFSVFIDVFKKMKDKCGATPSDLNTLKNELNRFFKDSTCKEVMYTNNTDKMFFGMKTLAMIDADDIYDYLVDDEPKRITKYIIEIDSHLFNPVLDLNPKELIILQKINRCFIHQMNLKYLLMSSQKIMDLIMSFLLHLIRLHQII